ncbi:hypothetical protein NUW58_g3154 [Xylaria curta]|uniref:Uncharacterized protein n=1 Tax=Xylaria curta TaxID=42375 RepID=A0ACC1PC93_9PEZI|nr:hypothetical protein NUW58_g3154 [Xylaria curta]
MKSTAILLVYNFTHALAYPGMNKVLAEIQARGDLTIDARSDDLLGDLVSGVVTTVGQTIGNILQLGDSATVDGSLASYKPPGQLGSSACKSDDNGRVARRSKANSLADIPTSEIIIIPVVRHDVLLCSNERARSVASVVGGLYANDAMLAMMWLVSSDAQAQSREIFKPEKRLKEIEDRTLAWPR